MKSAARPPPEGRFPQYKGQLQPYSLYVPTAYERGRPAGLTLALVLTGAAAAAVAVQRDDRCPADLDVPTSTWSGTSTGASFCRIAGHEVPFSHQRLAGLYPTHGSYVRAVVRSVRELVAARFLTPRDGRAVVREAVRADIP